MKTKAKSGRKTTTRPSRRDRAPKLQSGPVAAASPDRPGRRSATALPKKSRIRVLIADDHTVVREGLVSLIQRKPDMTVIGEAKNGREAVDLWKRHGPDVTLLDLRMPELDGNHVTPAGPARHEAGRAGRSLTTRRPGSSAKNPGGGVGSGRWCS